MTHNKNNRLSRQEPMLLVCDPEGKIIQSSTQFHIHSGYAQEALLGWNLSQLKHADMPEGPFTDLWKTVRSGKPWMGILSLAKQDQHPLWVDAYVLPVVDHEKLVELHLILQPASQDVETRAHQVYQLRKQGKMPWSLRLPSISLGQRLSLLIFLAMLPLWLGLALWTPGWPALLLSLASAVFAGIGIFSLTRPLQKLVAESRQRVSHPVKQLIYTGRVDEVGQLQLAMQLQHNQLAAILCRMRYSADDVRLSADQTVEVMRGTCEDLFRQQDVLTQVATAIEEIAQTVDAMSGNTNEVADQASGAQKQAQEGCGAVSASVQSIRHLASSIRDTEQAVTSLADVSAQIGNIVNVIRAISEQTNLLALNAAIEAARAGENGRGFAVVADEVRQLAQRTQSATGEIDGMIVSLQQETERIVEAMANKRSLSDASVARIEQTGERLHQILQAVDQISTMTHQLATASEQQTAVTSEVSHRLQDLHLQGQNTVAEASKTLELNHQSAQQAERQRFLVRALAQA
ncbi:methyl-accepting chemotaxis protein [Nitrincola tapanii]|nr:methyl-accepting chemotaxis protein [Nitrincola tapanii]